MPQVAPESGLTASEGVDMKEKKKVALSATSMDPELVEAMKQFDFDGSGEVDVSVRLAEKTT